MSLSAPKMVWISGIATSMPPNTMLVGPSSRLLSKAATSAGQLPATWSATDRLMTPSGSQQSSVINS
eukprot:4078796-Lingulodinium_polyedra.AAC.1